MNNAGSGTVAATTMGAAAFGPQGSTPLAIGLVLIVNNPGLAGLLVVTLNGYDNGVAWSRPVASIALGILSLSVGQRMEYLITEVCDSVGCTADFVFVGVGGSPSLSYKFGFI